MVFLGPIKRKPGNVAEVACPAVGIRQKSKGHQRGKHQEHFREMTSERGCEECDLEDQKKALLGCNHSALLGLKDAVHYEHRRTCECWPATGRGNRQAGAGRIGTRN